MSELREEYLDKALGSPGLAATLLALDLMRGDPASFKAGYTAPNAALRAAEVFPEVSAEAIERRL